VTDLPGRLQAALADRYLLERELGRGDMATVYVAHDLRHDRPVALKVLHPELAQTLAPDRRWTRRERRARAGGSGWSVASGLRTRNAGSGATNGGSS